MGRVARVVIPGRPHHITQRGNFRQTVFGDDEDRVEYLKRLRECSERSGTRVWAYCLMTNHVHLIAVPERADSLARTFNQAHMLYAQYSNLKNRRSGHLWQGRFYSCVLGEDHLAAAVRYVERNPVRAGMVARAEEFRWSSARAHALGDGDPILAGDCPLLQTVKDWASFLAPLDEMPVVEQIRSSSRTGRPLGSRGFVDEVEAALGRTVRARPEGRPFKCNN